MKHYKLIILLLTALSFQVTAQNEVILNINHKLGDETFAMNQPAKNNMDHDFTVTRLEYYISGISLVHDGGAETSVDDLYILADASTKTEVVLGEYDITTVEKIIMHIGVDNAANHADPTLWDADHPLAPRSPAMHWGWAAGYRFVALEGKGGSALNQAVELHGLGDRNYSATEVEVDVTAENGLVTIALDADYVKALDDISLSSGVIVHGDSFQAKDCLENFRDFVFSESGTTSSTIDHSEVNAFSIFPNPITDGNASVVLDLKVSGNHYDLSITSVEGRMIAYMSDISEGQRMDFSDFNAGFYFINLVKENQTVLTQKVVVK